MVLTVILIIIGNLSPTDSFILGLNIPFLQILPTVAFLFFFMMTTWIPRTVSPDTSYQICFPLFS